MAPAGPAQASAPSRHAWRMVAAAAALVIMSAQAQEPADAPAAAAPDDAAQPATIPVPDRDTPAPVAQPRGGAPTRLDDVVVTATKRPKSARELPASINALQGDQLEKMGASEMRDYLNLIPGISMQDSADTDFNSGRKIAIRGIAPSDTANQTTGILLGDVSLTDPYLSFVIPDVDPFDLSTVEVLKGPQGTLFGASALNGAIRYVPNAPEFGQWQGKLFADGRSTRHSGRGGSAGAALNIPLGDTFALRTTGLMQYTPGLYDAVSPSYTQARADSSHKWDARAQARWEPGERFGVNLLYMIQQRRADGLSIADNGDGDFKNSLQAPSTLQMNFDVANLDLRYNFDWATLVLQSSRSTKYRRTDVDSSALLTPPLPAGLLVLRTLASASILSWTEELRLVSNDAGPWVWLAGLYYNRYRNHAALDQDYFPATRGVAPIIAVLPVIGPATVSDNGLSAANGGFSPQPLLATERAAFGELTRKLGEHWQLTAGGRAYRTRLGSDLTLQGLLVPVLFHSGTTYQNHYELSAGGFSPKFSVSWQASRDFMAYASASRGFQFGGINIYPSVDPRYTTPGSFKSSKLWSYEIGERSDWFDRTLRGDVTAFWIEWANPQIIQDAPGANIYTYVDNVGAARSRGIEAALRWLTPLSGLQLSSSAAYIVARSTVPYTAADGTLVPAGADMPQTPRWQVANTITYTANLGGWLIGPSVVHSFQGAAWNDIEHHHGIYGYNTLNLSLNASRPTGSFSPELNLGVNNLTDVRALNSYSSGALISNFSELIGHTNASYTRPRSISLRIGVSF